MKLPIDILCGSARVRETLEAGRSPRLLAREWARAAAGFRRRRQRDLLY